MGTMGSRSLQVGGTAVQRATDEVLEKGQAARRAPARGRRGRHRGRPGRGPRRRRLARLGDPVGAAGPGRGRPSRPGGLRGRAGRRERLRDAGRDVPVRHPPRRRRGRHRDRAGGPHPPHHRRRRGPDRATRCCVEGQVHGGIAQGVAQALFEEIAFDEDGNNVTGSLASYAIPCAGDLPTFETERTADADAAQPAGRQGHRRGGRDRRDAGRLERGRRRALAPSASSNIDMPATPQRVWQAISAADASAISTSTSSTVRAEPDARPDRSGQLGLAARLQLGVQAPGLLVGDVAAAG